MTIFKKIFFVSLIIFFLSLLFWGVYKLSFSKKDTLTEDTDTPKINLPFQNNQPISVLSSDAILAPTLTLEGNIKYYSRANGKVYQIDQDGENKKIIADKELINLTNVLWSPEQDKVITSFNRTNNQLQFFYYNYQTEKGVAIKDNVDEIAWHTSGNRIFYKYYDPASKVRSLNIADPDGTNWKKLTEISYRNVSIAPVPKTGLVSFWNKPDSFTETILESIPVIGGEKKTIFQGKFGADYLWSPDGNYILLSHSEEKGGNKMQLGIMNYNGGEYKNLSLPTFVSKCIWSKDNVTLYCSLPGGLSESAVLPNDYLSGQIFSADTFWKINTKSGEKSRLLEPEKIKEKIDATNFFLNNDESALFFINKIDGKLYKISL